MPVTKSAKKKLKQDKKRTLRNNELKNLFKNSVKTAKRKPTSENLRKAFKAIDKTAKANIIHRNKAARIKSNLSKKTPVGQKPASAAAKIQKETKVLKKASSKKAQKKTS